MYSSIKFHFWQASFIIFEATTIKNFYLHKGTAGVWRIKAINDAGGWKDRTTVEDMDLAVRASLRGWKFLFVGDLSVSCWTVQFAS